MTSNKANIYQIEINTNSNSETDRWKLMSDGKELLVSDIIIESKAYTTGDHIEEIGDKRHISCFGVLEIKNGIAYISDVKNNHAIFRHALKTITWRIVGTLDTILLSWLITGNFQVGLGIGGAELITKMTLYYIHERLWYRSRFDLGEKG